MCDAHLIWRVRAALFVGAIALAGCNFAQGGLATAANVQPTQPNAPPTSPPASDDCLHVYFPVDEGASWTYAGTSIAGAYTEVDTITDVGTSAFLLEVGLTNVTWVETWKCTAEGLTQLMSDGGQWSVILRGPDDSVGIERLSQSGVTYPLSIRTGDSWSQETAFHLTSSSINGDGRLTYEFHAVGPEEVTVPAGTYQAMRIDVIAVMEAVAYGPEMTTYYDGTIWLAPVVGRVKQTGVTRVGQATTEGIPSTVELTSYQAP